MGSFSVNSWLRGEQGGLVHPAALKTITMPLFRRRRPGRWQWWEQRRWKLAIQWRFRATIGWRKLFHSV
jgi:hypothetical protein